MDFNPRLQEGGDPIIKTDFTTGQNFNPRLQEGGDLMSDIKEATQGTFQSTPPRRRRPKSATIFKYVFDFNPRLQEGGDR